MSETKVNLDLGLRDYEVQVWTLQDSYLATLKWSKADHKGQIYDAKMGLVDDGTQGFSFTIPMYLYVEEDETLRKIENPIWYMTQEENGDVIIKNMHKIKVIINKTLGTNVQKQQAHERVYEFLITKVTEAHEEDNPECRVECEGLAFHELGKQGYKVELSSEVFYDRLKKYSEGKVWYDNNHIGHEEEPIETIDYWMNDLNIEQYEYKNVIIDNMFKYIAGRTASEVSPKKWYYKVDMKYDSFSILPNGKTRRNDKIYEDAYVSSWTENLDPKTIQCVLEKRRLVDSNESNIYNLTQTIAETFNVFCRYEYVYDLNYSIVGRLIVFYNNFVQDDNELIELTYPHTSLSIEREYDSTDITTKMYVRPEEDDSTLTGQISIIDTESNPTKEDYIMNFDYFHKIGTISDEQYNSIEPYNKLMRKYNAGEVDIIRQINAQNNNPSVGNTAAVDGITYTYTNTGWVDPNGRNIEGIISLQERLIAKQERKVEVESKLKVAENSVKLAVERINDAQKHIVSASTSVIDYRNPQQYIVLSDGNSNRYITLSSNHREINFDSIRIFRKYIQGKANWDESFPSLETTALPPAEPISINWASASARNAKKTYKKITKDIGSEEDYSTIEAKFEAWCAALNNPAAAITIPDTRSSAIEPGDSESAFYSSIDILNDYVGWVLCAIGQGTVEKVDFGEKQKRYMITELDYNGRAYHLSLNTNKKISPLGWNGCCAARYAWKLGVCEGLKKANVSVTYTSASCTVTARPAWPEQNSANLTVDCSGSGHSVLWKYQGREANSIFDLWSSTNYRNSYSCYYDFLGTEFGILVGPNEVLHFVGKYDSNNSLIQLVNLPDIVSGKRVYLTYSFNPDTYYRQVQEMWIKKRDQASSEQVTYQTELDLLEAQIDALTEEIRLRLKEKHDAIKDFEAVMGPALRESYWQPEDYHNYGDTYTATLGTNGFTYAQDTDDNTTNVYAKFLWDNELFSEESKCYYEYSVIQNQRYYESINLQAFYNSLDATGKTAFFNHLDSLTFAFYNDDFDRDYEGVLMHVAAGGARQWYYRQDYDLGNAGQYYHEINVYRQEKNRKMYVIGASMEFSFIRNMSDNKVIPIILVTGLDEMPDSVINYIHQTDDYTGTSYGAGNYTIHPGAQPMLGYLDSSNQFVALGKVTDAHWILRTTTSSGSYETVYPRIKVNSLQLKRTSLVLSCVKPTSGNVIDEANLLKNPDDYYVFNRRTSYYITIKPQVLFKTLGITSSRKINVVTDIAFAGVTDNATITPYLNGIKDIIYSIDDNRNVTITDPPLPVNYTVSYNSIVTNGVVNDLKLKQQILQAYGLIYPFNLTYTISNGGTFIYIDALDVMKENSIPKVAYTVKPNLKNHPTTFLYDNIGQIVMINDYELKLDNVFGYISEVQLDLDHPWEDEITVKDYKNKFEDLFSSITAEVEAMKKNNGVLAALSTGILTPMISSAYSEMNYASFYSADFIDILNEFLNSHFDGREVVVSELNEIFSEAWGIMEQGYDALGELATSNQYNANMLASLLGNINERLKPSLLSITGNDPNANNSGITDYKIGDICVTADGSRYMAVANIGDGAEVPFKPIYDGTVSSIKGASFELDAEHGTINLLSENELNIKSGSKLYIAAGAEVDIVGNQSVNIGGTTINICSGVIVDENDVETPVSTGGVNIISSSIDTLNPERTLLSGVFIKPDNIEMISSDIKMIAGLANTNNGTTVGSAMLVSGTEGIWMGTNTTAGIRLYSGAIDYSEDLVGTDIKSNITNGSSLEILQGSITLGTISQGNFGSVVLIEPSNIIMAVGNTAGTLGQDGGLTGVKISQSEIGFATGADDHFGTVLINQYGFTAGGGDGFNANLSDDYITGSFVRINADGVRIGSTSNLYLNTDNIKLQSDGGYDTRFAIGYLLNNLLAGTLDAIGDTEDFSSYVYPQYDQNDNLKPSLRMLVNDHGLFASGILYANELFIKNYDYDNQVWRYLKFDGDLTVDTAHVVIMPNAYYDNSASYVFYVGTDRTAQNNDTEGQYIKLLTDGTFIVKGAIQADSLYIGVSAGTTLESFLSNHDYQTSSGVRSILTDGGYATQAWTQGYCSETYQTAEEVRSTVTGQLGSSYVSLREDGLTVDANGMRVEMHSYGVNIYGPADDDSDGGQSNTGKLRICIDDSNYARLTVAKSGNTIKLKCRLWVNGVGHSTTLAEWTAS